MKRTERFSYLILLFVSIGIVFRLYIWFFNTIWDSSWVVQRKEILLFTGILLIIYGISVFITLSRSEAWKNLKRENALPAIFRNLIFQVSFWFGIGICLRVVRLFF